MQLITHYGVDIEYWPEDGEPAVYRYALCGWVYEVKTLEEAKADIKKNWRQNQTYWKNF